MTSPFIRWLDTLTDHYHLIVVAADTGYLVRQYLRVGDRRFSVERELTPEEFAAARAWNAASRARKGITAQQTNQEAAGHSPEVLDLKPGPASEEPDPTCDHYYQLREI